MHTEGKLSENRGLPFLVSLEINFQNLFELFQCLLDYRNGYTEIVKVHKTKHNGYRSNHLMPQPPSVISSV